MQMQMPEPIIPPGPPSVPPEPLPGEDMPPLPVNDPPPNDLPGERPPMQMHRGGFTVRV